jgi:MFS family permease
MSATNNLPPPDAGTKGMDASAILRSALPPFIVWLAWVLSITFYRRQPGVICMTPLAWLLACWVGGACVTRSRSERRATLLKEAALAGGTLGLLQGLLFVVITAYIGEIKPEERQKALLLNLAMVALGVVVSAILSAAVGAGRARQRGAT